MSDEIFGPCRDLSDYDFFAMFEHWGSRLGSRKWAFSQSITCSAYVPVRPVVYAVFTLASTLHILIAPMVFETFDRENVLSKRFLKLLKRGGSLLELVRDCQSLLEEFLSSLKFPGVHVPLMAKKLPATYPPSSSLSVLSHMPHDFSQRDMARFYSSLLTSPFARLLGRVTWPQFYMQYIRSQEKNTHRQIVE
ncbi:hypothetical protein P154DRAFT_120809 [Amniculicola lignicola CBS 123094]|uniref:Uncharacterized protein n=1 Tax=Amniculicola lignicola CBS 123094 TaxID=1392246 RepID=A0A6A5X3N5_9PLEO|nr:hypothetical protein P154DRAFT_120809 [Amniculicola lignicola CBS 123094]